MSRVPVDHARGEELTYLQALAEGRVVFQVCDDCGSAVWYLRTVCPFCMSAALREHTAVGTGTIHSLTTLHRAGNAARVGDLPYTVALVDLDEGVRVIGDLADADNGPLAIGDRVTAHPYPDGVVFEALERNAR
ncbi:Zn-ribbon domain-containing OB-fold protein [Leifsonia sp. NPDC058230]|uniref:Zn-ribbon domain-containing OB-fold protein n=1 Tax=Leifsonia sp. NPDC058230 TaxID=3346391 RepID=UPI0036D7FEEF